jgi:nicotinamidase/pyrazinamidase
MIPAKKTLLLIIDAQVDFCSPEGALYVPGAEEDINRLARLIGEAGDTIDHIVATLDTHQVLDIAHPGFWEAPNGTSPAPFTLIRWEEVESGAWRPRFEAEYARAYVRKLEDQGEFHHFIWPEHCLAGTHGAALADALASEMRQWAHSRGKNYETVIKGEHPLSEHFGVFRAQIPVPGVDKTELNQALLDELTTFDEIWMAGEARSHCVATSLKQILRYAPQLTRKITLLSDCMSDVPNMGHLAAPIYAEARRQGVRFTTSEALLSLT